MMSVLWAGSPSGPKEGDPRPHLRCPSTFWNVSTLPAPTEKRNTGGSTPPPPARFGTASFPAAKRSALAGTLSDPAGRADPVETADRALPSVIKMTSDRRADCMSPPRDGASLACDPRVGSRHLPPPCTCATVIVRLAVGGRG